MEGSDSDNSLPADRIKLNVGGKLFETTTSTLRSAGPESLLSALSNRPDHDPSKPIFIDRDPDIFSTLLSLLRSNRLPSSTNATARFTTQELLDEASYYGLEAHIKSALSPPTLSGIDACLHSTISPPSNAVVSDFNAVDSDGSLWVSHGGQISVYDWSLTHASTIRTHLDYISSVRKIRPEIAAIGSIYGSGLHFYNVVTGRRVDSLEWVDLTDPRIFKAKVNAIEDSVNWVFASVDCQHRENCVLQVDKDNMKVVAEIGRQNGSSAKNIVAGKLTWVPETGVLVGTSVTSGAFGYSGYIRMWDVRMKGNVVWETNEPGSGRSSRFGDSFGDVDVDSEELMLYKLCSKSGDIGMADMRKLTEDPWVYLKEKNPSMRVVDSSNSGLVIHCYRKQVFVGREGELEVWSRVVESCDGNHDSHGDGEGERALRDDVYRRNFVDKEEDSKRGVIQKIVGGGDRLFVTRENVEGIEVWQSTHFSGAVSIS